MSTSIKSYKQMQPMTETSSHPFIEVRGHPCPANGSSRLFVEVYTADIEAKECGTLVKRLSRELHLLQPSIDLSHLKRVHRVVDIVSLKAIQDSKRRKTTQAIQLKILLGAVSVIHQKFSVSPHGDSIAEKLEQTYNVANVCTLEVGGRVPESEDEWKLFNEHWPTSFFPHKTTAHLEKELELSERSLQQMRLGMRHALTDVTAHGTIKIPGAIVVFPDTGEVLATSTAERKYQESAERNPNPLATPILYAIQNVSRNERQSAISKGMDSPMFQRGQYLCTGLDVYTTLEPTVFEAMALVHARVRYVVFGCSSGTTQLGGLSEVKVHDLPGTNHRYRAFYCSPETDLGRQCRMLAPTETSPMK
jgi:tRNA(Arg) A34 adenosine deaminase TadA